MNEVQQQLDGRCPCISKPLAECACQTDPNPELAEVAESLKSAMPWLENAYCLIGSNGLNKRYERLYMSICDALHYAREAMERLEDEPDELYDVALSELPPTKGKIQPPESAF